MTTLSREAQIRARCEKAQDGPWHFEDGLDKQKYGFRIYDAHMWGVCKPTSSSPSQQEATAEFILHAREDIPWLLDQLASARADGATEAGKKLAQLQNDVGCAVSLSVHGKANSLQVIGLLQAALDRSKA